MTMSRSSCRGTFAAISARSQPVFSPGGATELTAPQRKPGVRKPARFASASLEPRARKGASKTMAQLGRRLASIPLNFDLIFPAAHLRQVVLAL